MKICRTMFVIMILVSSLFMTGAAAKNIFTIEDKLNDVTLEYEENLTHQYTDIETMTINRNNNEIELILELKDDGTIPENGVPLFIIYLPTTNNDYELYYGIIDENLTINAIAMSGESEEDILKDYSVNDNKLTFKFNLLESYEKVVGGVALITWGESLTSSGYSDEINYYENYYIPTVDAGGPYFTDEGGKITFSGSLDEGDPENYSWYWTIDDTSIVKEGKTAEQSFLLSGNYTGTLYISNDQGQYTIDTFEVQVNKTGSNNDDNNDSPGFEIFIVFVAFAIALIILKRRK